MAILLEYISVIGCFQGALLFVLLVMDGRMTIASKILGFICLIAASIFLTPFLLLYTEIDAVARITAWIVYLPAGLGALSFLYFRSALINQSFTIGDLVHITPWLLCCGLVGDMLFVNPQLIIGWVSGADRWWSWRLQVSEYLMFAQAFGYMGLTIWMIWRYRRRANDNLANFDPSVFKWSLLFQFFSMLIWLFKALSALTQISEPQYLWAVANLFLFTFIYLIALMQWRNPRLFTISHFSEESIASVLRTSPRPVTDKNGELTPALREELFETLKTQVESRKLYLDSEITLMRLADHVGLTKHHLSEVLNRHVGKNFYEFINGYRIDFARARFASDPTQKILDVALDAGFSSKTTFNVTFKRLTGKTPTQYCKALE